MKNRMEPCGAQYGNSTGKNKQKYLNFPTEFEGRPYRPGTLPKMAHCGHSGFDITYIDIEISIFRFRISIFLPILIK
jgi:hypothetical protein